MWTCPNDGMYMSGWKIVDIAGDEGCGYVRMTECIYIDAYIFEIFYVYEYIIKDTMPETEDYCYHIMMAPCKGNKRIAQGRA